MRRLSRQQLRQILIEEYNNAYLEEDAVFSSHDVPGDLDDHGGCSPCAARKKRQAKGDLDHDDCATCGSKSKHHAKSYMAKPQLAKISRYAQKLHDMIEDNEALQDWQESKIAQMSQMIGDVYHSIEYHEEYDDYHDDDLDMHDLIGMINTGNIY
jgi:hypothetical protein